MYIEKKKTRSILSMFVLCAALGYADAPECQPSARPYRISARHIEGKGVGYNKGYTSLDLFFSHLYNNSLPFIDLRGHIFDNGRYAANAGLGYRHLYRDYVFGGSVFYDYKTTNRFHYNQIGAGFEVLAKRWDFRLNGYLPVGAKQSSWYQSHFDGFKDHYLQIRRKQEFPMAGVNAEVGGYSDSIKSLWFYGGIGPYYYEGKGVNVYGGKLRLNGNYKTYASVEISGSYDNVFHDIFQIQVFVNIPFGPKIRSIKNTSLQACRNWNVVAERLVSPIERNEIIVTDDRHRNFIAIDPLTGEPYYFVFVNNTSSSNGTFESPYPTLDQALANAAAGNIIYIFPGDGTASGLTTDAGYQLLNNQQLLGAGYAYTFPTTAGTVQVPALAEGRPYLVGDTSADILIIPANHNTIAGLHLQTDGNAANCIESSDPIEDLTVINNLIEPLGANASSTGILSDLASGTFTIQNNTFNATTFSGGIQLMSSGGLVALITDNNLNDLSTFIVSNDFVCLRFQNNLSGVGGREFDADPGAIFNLEPFTGNDPNDYTSMGTITLVPENSCH